MKSPFRDKTTASEQLASQNVTETPKYRDVYDDQQIKRSRIAPMQTMTSRMIAAGIVALMVFMVVWVVFSGFQYGAAKFGGSLPWVYTSDSGKKTVFTTSYDKTPKVGNNSIMPGGQRDEENWPELWYGESGTWLGADVSKLDGEYFYDIDGYRRDRDGNYLDADGNVVGSQEEAYQSSTTGRDKYRRVMSEWESEVAAAEAEANGSTGTTGTQQTTQQGSGQASTTGTQQDVSTGDSTGTDAEAGGDSAVVSDVDPSSTSEDNLTYTAWRDENFTFLKEMGKTKYYTRNSTGEPMSKGQLDAEFALLYGQGQIPVRTGGSLVGGGTGGSAGVTGDDAAAGSVSGTGANGSAGNASGNNAGDAANGTGAGSGTSGANGSNTDDANGGWVDAEYQGPFYNSDDHNSRVLVSENKAGCPDDGSALYAEDGHIVRQATLMPEGTQQGTDETEKPETYDLPGVGVVQKDHIAKAGLGHYLLKFSILKLLVSLLGAFAVYGLMYTVLKKNLDAQNMLNDTSDINQYHNDQHVQTPQEVQKAYDWFPDVGAHAPVQVSSMISHMMLSKKGLKLVPMVRRADKDIKNKDGSVAYYKGEPLLDGDGEPIVDMLPIIDEKFGEALFEASGLPAEKNEETGRPLRTRFVAKDILYNPGNKNRDKVKDAETVADLINKFWEFPDYEPQRPAGAYIVDTQPVNTMV